MLLNNMKNKIYLFTHKMVQKSLLFFTIQKLINFSSEQRNTTNLSFIHSHHTDLYFYVSCNSANDTHPPPPPPVWHGTFNNMFRWIFGKNCVANEKIIKYPLNPAIGYLNQSIWGRGFVEEVHLTYCYCVVAEA